MKKVTDPALLQQLGTPVKDPAILAQLNGIPQPFNWDKGNAGVIEQANPLAIAGVADEAGALFDTGTKYVGQRGANLLGYNVLQESFDKRYSGALNRRRENINLARESLPISSLGANIAGLLFTGGLGAESATGTAIANSLRSGNLAARSTKGALTAATSGQVLGFGEGEGGIDNRLEKSKEYRNVGALLGSAIPVAGALGGAALRTGKNALMPTVNEGVRDLAKRAQDFGFQLSIDQVVPSKVRNTIQKVSQEIPFSGSDAAQEKNLQVFHKNLAKTLGEESASLGPETIKSFAENNSAKFNSAVGDTDINFDNVALSRLDDIGAKAQKYVTKDIANIVKGNISDFKSNLSGNQINGQKLASFRSQLIKDIPGASGEAKKYLGDMVDVIDDIAAKNLSKEGAQTLSRARYEYRNFKTLEPLLEKSTNGRINPTELLSRVKASPYIKASKTATGDDELVDLARIGKEFLPVKGGSDTFQKSALTGAGVAAYYEPTTLALTGGTIGLNRAYQSFYNRNQGLVNKIIQGTKISPTELKKLPIEEQKQMLNYIKKTDKMTPEELREFIKQEGL